MANPAFEPEKVLGDKIIKMDKEVYYEPFIFLGGYPRAGTQ